MELRNTSMLLQTVAPCTFPRAHKRMATSDARSSRYLQSNEIMCFPYAINKNKF